MSSDELQEPRNWKVKNRDGSRLEPANLNVLREWVASGQIGPEDLVINEKLPDWIPASDVIELADLFGKPAPKSASPAPSDDKTAPEPIEKADEEVEVPDCAYHPDRKASEICVGCGKFICEECRQRFERKIYCHRCMAEAQAGIEPGAPVGPGVSRQTAPGGPASTRMSKLAVASLVFSIAALLAAVAMIILKPDVMTALAAAFIAFTAALLAGLLGGLALNRIRSVGGSMRGKGLALTGLISGCVLLVGSLALATVFTMGKQAAPGKKSVPLGGLLQGAPSRRQAALRQPGSKQPTPNLTKQAREERETNARQLLEQARKHLDEGRLEQAISACKIILGLYPETNTARLVEERLPVLEETLSRQQAEVQTLKRQDEQAAQLRFEHALKMYSEGDQAVALDLLKSIGKTYPKTDVARQARAEAAKIEQTITDEKARKLDKEASQLAVQADRQIEDEQYDEAVKLYSKIVEEYPQTPTAASVKLKLEEARLLATEPSEREFHNIQKEVDTVTYDEAVALLQGFLKKHWNSRHAAKAQELLKENQKSKNAADSLFNFGRAYFEDQKYGNALTMYGKLIKSYPRSRWIPQANEAHEETLGKLRE